MDNVVSQVRSRMMSNIRAKNTKPEMLVRRGLHADGLRFRLHSRKLPGKPDIVLPKFTSVVFVNGCFWHGHDCNLFRLPKTRREFWKDKIEGNQARDKRNIQQLIAQGWRIAIVWECALKSKSQNSVREVITTLCSWLRNSEIRFIDISVKGIYPAP